MGNNTNTESMAPELITLREAFLAHVRALIAEHPAQAQNERYYLRQAATARLGRMRSAVSTKGNFSTYNVGELVLVWVPEWSMSQDATIFHPRNTWQTQVQKYAVEVVS